MYLWRNAALPLLAVSVAEDEVEDVEVDDALVDSEFGANPAGTEMEEDICPVDLERTLRPFSCKLLLIESSSGGCEDMAEEEFDEGIFSVADFLRCVRSEASRAPKLFFDLLEGALVDRVNVDVWCGVVVPFLPFLASSFKLRLFGLSDKVAILSRSISPA